MSDHGLAPWLTVPTTPRFVLHDVLVWTNMISMLNNNSFVFMSLRYKHHNCVFTQLDSVWITGFKRNYRFKRILHTVPYTTGYLRRIMHSIQILCKWMPVTFFIQIEDVFIWTQKHVQVRELCSCLRLPHDAAVPNHTCVLWCVAFLVDFCKSPFYFKTYQDDELVKT